MTKHRPIIAISGNHLHALIQMHVSRYGPQCSLNHIDVSNIEDFSWTFQNSEFCGDISKWNTAKMHSAQYMFADSKFNGDISRWNTRALMSSTCMFQNSHFDDDLSQWDTKRLQYADNMFRNSRFSGDLHAWSLQINRSYGFDFPATFKGTPPYLVVPDIGQYASMFETEYRLHEYLGQTPFNGIHFDVCALAAQKPHWASIEDYIWAKHHHETGTTLGLSATEIRTHALALRNQSRVEVPLHIDIDFLAGHVVHASR